MPRLRMVSTRDPGWTRVRHGRGHRYLDVDGSPLGAEQVARVKAMVIPPAWRDVWISPHPNAHLLAVGTDDAGRRQYLYHPVWRQRQDEAKFDRVITMAGHLPRVRRRIRGALTAHADGPPSYEVALATAVRLVDLGCFRLGSDAYTEANGSYGLTTLERRHVQRRPGACVFSFVGKSGVEHTVALDDPLLCAVIAGMTRRRGDDARLLAGKVGRRWVALDAAEVNAHIRDLFGMDVTAKDFRTWHATVHVAGALGRSGPASSSRARAAAVRSAVVSASALLGNTPTVCRSSYVDPRVIELYEADVTVADALIRMPADPDRARGRLDRAVVRLLTA